MPKILRTIFIIVVIIAGLAVLFLAGSFAYGKFYAGKVYPGVSVGPYQLGGMTAGEIKKFAAQFAARLEKEGLTYIFSENGEEKKIIVNPAVISSEAAFEMAAIDGDGLAAAALSAGRSGGRFWELLNGPLALLRPIRLGLPVKIDRAGFTQILKNSFAAFEQPPVDAGLAFSVWSPLSPASSIKRGEPLDLHLTDEKSGEIFDYDSLLADTETHLANFSLGPIEAVRRPASPKIYKSDLGGLEEKFFALLNFGDLIFVASSTDGETLQWQVPLEKWAGWLAPRRAADGQIFLAPSDEALNKYFDETIRPEFDQPAKEPKFNMENGKAKEFQVGQAGERLDAATTTAILAQLLENYSRGLSAAAPVPLAVEKSEPKMNLANINNLGITGIFGAGTSTFYDSHTNRIKNIAHAVERLNGTLIAPGEEFSAIKYAGPFTSENGYLPEEVIKGKKIEKEIGGGMCQIGTTLFRMAMNSGMPITERTNHSLVVHYYADPVNGNPGTDATVYEPILDFKFLNDTGNYLLLQTEISYKKQRLTFTLWGKPDGRSGSFNRPLVSRWIPAGSPIDIYSADLKPGERKCQNAFRGAVASFTYTRFTTSSEKIDRVFTSVYRPLPKICLVGVDPNLPPPCEIGAECPVVVPTSTPKQ